MKKKVIDILICMLLIVIVVPIVGAADWNKEQKIFAGGGAEYDSFGGSVSISGDTALIGAVNDDNGKGSAYVFTRTDSTWAQQYKLHASDSVARDFFGFSISLDGDTALIGAPADEENGYAAGSAYIFTRIGNSWTQQQKLLPLDGVAGDWFGCSVSISGDTALIGVPGDDDYKGSAYVFNRTKSTWTQQQKILAEDGLAWDTFGCSVSISYNTALIGAYHDDYKGSAYVFTLTDSTWAQQYKLHASDGAVADSFGYSVSISGDTALIGVENDDDYKGSAYVFNRTKSTWTQQQKILAGDGAEGDSFGCSVSISGGTSLIGAYGDDIYKGSAYVFTKERVGKKALLIGCWKYPGADAESIKLDLRNMENLLLDNHFRKQDITVLYNPIKNQIREAINIFQCNQGVTNVLYMSGHGNHDDNTKKEFFEASDGYVYWDSELETDLSGFQNIAIIFDICHSGGLCKSTDKSPDNEGIDGDSKVVLMSCESDEVSGWDKLGGIFTYHLYKAFYNSNNTVDPSVSVDDSFVNASNIISKKSFVSPEICFRMHPRMYDAWLSESNHGDEFYLSSSSPKSYKSISLKCPVHLHCYDTQNNHVGINADGSIDLNISNIGYSGPWYEDEFLVISANDTIDYYRIVADAYDDGFFTLECHDFNQETTETSTILYQNILISSTTIASIIINGNVFGDLLIDDNGDDITDRTVSPTIYPEKIFTPNAIFNYNPESPKKNQEICFNASSSYDEDGDIIDYTWDFGDGTTGNGEIITHTYSNPGEYLIKLSVTDNVGLTTITQKKIQVIILPVIIDIKPGSYPNSINPKSKGNVPVAILADDDFDASNVDSDTVEFLDASPDHWALEDVDNDGDLDMILHFKTQQLNFTQLVDEGGEYPYAYLTGETTSGELIEGKDTVRLVGTKIQTYNPIIQLLLKILERFPFLEKILNQYL